MRFRIKILSIIIALLLLAAFSAKSSAFAQDPNLPDTVYIDSTQSPLSEWAVAINFVNDQPLAGFEITLKYDYDPALIFLDSFSFVGSRVDYIPTKGMTRHYLDSAISIWGFPLSEPLIPSGSGLLGHLHFSYPDSLDSILVKIDSVNVQNLLIHWSTSFSDSLANQFAPQFEFGYLYINRELCCIDQVGDVNYDGVDANILDLTYLVDRIFRGGPELFCPEEGDFDQDPDGNVNVVDLVYLVDYIFRGGPAPPDCPY
ncbi:MAG: hypothetical protein IID63_01680 [candidate division Zixibacteria bacterium]|nr:hypothetical protein [candidate division Zixibacteria bacterium]